jgi:NAD(P)-dependent dehydrogenase (short-subunit alcohol dehydrogenase family)
LTNKPNNRQTATLDKNAAFYTAVPLKRGAKPDEIADAIIFLASERASFITGKIVWINGSKTAS